MRYTKRGGGVLEDYLRTKPFEGYTLYRGKFHPDASKSTLRPVGALKAIIRVLDSDPREAEEGEFVSLRALEAKRYVVRVYCVKASSLQPKDSSGTSDPFLRLKLGDQVQDRRAARCEKTLSPDFFQSFEFTTVLPGPATLKVQVKDFNRLHIDLKAADELIGSSGLRRLHRSGEDTRS